MNGFIDVDSKLEEIKSSKTSIKNLLAITTNQLSDLKKPLVQVAIDKIDFANWFLAEKNRSHLSIFKDGKRLISKLEEDRQAYLSFQERNLTFSKSPKKSAMNVDPDKSYNVNFQGTKKGSGEAELYILTFSNGSKGKTYKVEVGNKAAIKFNQDVTDVRLALKITGSVKISFEQIVIIEQPLIKVQQEDKQDKLSSFLENVEALQETNDEVIPKKDIKIATILDTFSYDAFKYEADLLKLSLSNWKEEIEKEQPAMLLVESAWHGNEGSWKYKVSRLHEKENETNLKDLVDFCKSLKIPTVFWDKEGAINFENFKAAAAFFDYIFVTDENSIDKYKQVCNHANIFPLSFAAQPKIHNPINRLKHPLGEVAFAGSWYGEKHQDRLKDMENIIKPALNFELDIFDRHYGNPKYQWPQIYQNSILGKLDYKHMIEAYKNYNIFLNVNSVQDSEYMFSRRVYELLASRTMVISGKSTGVAKQLGDYLYVSDSEKQTNRIMQLLRNSPLKREREAKRAQRFIYNNHTYTHRLEEMLNIVGIPFNQVEQSGVTAIISTNRPDYIDNVYGTISRQNYENVEYIIVLNSNTMNVRQWEEKFKEFKNLSIMQIDESKNLTYCLNRAIEKANFEIIAKIDDDDYYAENYLSDMVQAFDYTDASIIGKGEYFVYLEHLKILGRRKIGKYSSEERYTNLVSGATLVFKKEIVDKVGGFDEELPRGGDTDFLKKATELGYKTYSNDIFNFVLIRRDDKKSHTWQLDDQGILQKTSIESFTNDYVTHVSI